MVGISATVRYRVKCQDFSSDDTRAVKRLDGTDERRFRSKEVFFSMAVEEIWSSSSRREIIGVDDFRPEMFFSKMDWVKIQEQAIFYGCLWASMRTRE